MPYKNITPPAGDKITRTQTLNVPDRPVIPFIRGDGTGPDIWAASERVLDAACRKAVAIRMLGARAQVVERQTRCLEGAVLF